MPSGELVGTTLKFTGREVTDGHSHFPTPPSGRPQTKGAGRIIHVPDLQGQTGVLLNDAFRHKLMEREVLPSSISNFGRCGAIFTTGIAELSILASQSHVRVLPHATVKQEPRA